MTDGLVPQQRVEDCAKAVGAKDIDRVMSFYAPSIVSFDIDGPLRYAGLERRNRIRLMSRENHGRMDTSLMIRHAPTRPGTINTDTYMRKAL